MHEFWRRVAFALRCFFSILLHGGIPEDIARELIKVPAHTDVIAGTARDSAPSSADQARRIEQKTSESFDRAVQMLALLQRDGRLIDFFSEDIAPYPDAQLGAAVRTVHENCRKVLERYFKLEPILDSEEDRPVTVPAGFDATAIKLVGNVVGEPPVRGLLRHRGWRVKEASLPSLPEGSGRSVVAPAEVEVP